MRDEIALELPRDRDGRLLDALVQEIDRTPASVGFWAEKDPFGLPEQEQLRLSWRSFAEFVMHQRRFFFRQADLPEPEWWEPELLAPDKLLQQIGERAIDVGLIAKLSAGLWFTVRDINPIVLRMTPRKRWAHRLPRALGRIG